jgi:hypothetical protein
MSSQYISRPIARQAERLGYSVVGVAIFKRRSDGVKVFVQRHAGGWSVGRTLSTSKPVNYRTWPKAIEAAEALFELEA